MRPRISALAFATLALAACGSGAPEPVGMAFELPDPAVLDYVTGDTVRIDIDAGGQSLQARIATSAAVGVTFTRVDDGVQVSMAFDDFSGRLTQPMGGPQTADASDIDGPLLFTLDRRGHASRVTEPDLSGNAPQFLQPLALAHTFFPRVPGGPVPAGHTWQDTIRYDGETGGGQEVSAVSTLTYTVVGDTLVDGRSLLHVSAQGSTEQSARGTIAGQSFTQSIRGDLEGSYFWDLQRRLMVESVMDVDARGTMNVAIAPVPLSIRVRGQTETRLAN